MYGRSDVNVIVKQGSTFTFTRGFSQIVSILFTHVKPVKVYVCTHVKITRQWKSTFRRDLEKTEEFWLAKVNDFMRSQKDLRLQYNKWKWYQKKKKKNKFA